MNGKTGGPQWKLHKIMMEQRIQILLFIFLVLIILPFDIPVITWDAFNENREEYIEVFNTFFAFYIGYLFLEIIKILRKPQIVYSCWAEFNSPRPIGDGLRRGQLMLKLELKQDLFNKLFGTEMLPKLESSLKINNIRFPGRWTNNPEPSIDFRNIPQNQFTYLRPGKGDILAICWIDLGTGIYYGVDEYNYFDWRQENLIVSFPSQIEVTLFNYDDIYKFKICYKKNSIDHQINYLNQIITVVHIVN